MGSKATEYKLTPQKSTKSLDAVWTNTKVGKASVIV